MQVLSLIVSNLLGFEQNEPVQGFQLILFQ